MMLRTVFLLSILSVGLLSAQEAALDLGGLDEVLPATETTKPVEIPKSEEGEPEEGEEAGVPAKTGAPKRRSSFFDIVLAGGLIGHTIILLSFVSVALMIEHALSIRQKTLMPPNLAEDVLKLLSQGQLGQALQKCQDDPSVLAQVLHGGMSEYELGWNAVEKGAEEATAEQASRLYRKIEYLNVIGNITPMLGLLGTVVGMVFAFQNLAESEGYARAADLAEGIYLALVTTVEGLIVAIPSLAAYSLFSNRIADLVGETTFVAEQVLTPIKKSFIKKRPTT